jgi:hypothetical protein
VVVWQLREQGATLGVIPANDLPPLLHQSCRGSAARRSHRVVARGHPPSRMASQYRLAPTVIEAIAVLRVVHRRINRDHPGKDSDGHHQDSLHAQQPRRNRPSAPGPPAPSVCQRILVAVPVACPDDTRAATRAATPMYYLEQAHTSSDENALVSRGSGPTRTASNMAEPAF